MSCSDALADCQHPRFARFYAWISRAIDERGGGAEHRAWLLAPLSGQVIEIGAGNGRNFAHYPATVTRVLAVEPDESMRAMAAAAATRAPVPVEIAAGRAETLPAGDAEYDAALLSLVLCSIADPLAALAEVRRVLRPGGVLRFYEHVRSTRPAIGLVQDAVTPLWSHVCGGCHPNRDTVATIETAGFAVTELEEFALGGMRHLLGSARAPISASR